MQQFLAAIETISHKIQENDVCLHEQGFTGCMYHTVDIILVEMVKESHQCVGINLVEFNLNVIADMVKVNYYRNHSTVNTAKITIDRFLNFG